jgi:hypothetical protein
MSWLNNVIIEGIQTCVAVRLRNAPAFETLEQVAKIWVMVFERQPIAWNKEQDLWRIQDAFLAVLGESETFPAPKKVLDFMPNRKAIEYRLPRPESKPMPENIRSEMNRVFRMSPSECAAEANRILNNMIKPLGVKHD